jgi:hypothetical protein
MKKIIAISVMFALFAGAVFAETSLGFGLQFDATIVENDTGKGTGTSKSGITIGDHQVNADFKNDEGTAGGRLRFWGQDTNGLTPFAFAWWKPIDQLKVQFGHNKDADWGAKNITGWGFTGSASSSVAVQYDGSYGGIWKTANEGFYNGFGMAGAAISIYPMDALSIGIGLPLAGGDFVNNWERKETYETYPYSHINIKYNLEGLGTISFSFVGQGGLESKHHDPKSIDGSQLSNFLDPTNGDFDDFSKIKTGGKSVGDLYASFYLTMIEGINIDFGVGFGLPYTFAETDDGTYISTYKYNPGLKVGVAADYTGDGFGVKAGVGVALAESYTTTIEVGGVSGSGTAKEPMKIGVRVLPYYALDICTVYFQFGFGYQAAPEGGKAASDWFINPYIKKSVGNLDFFAGVKVGAPDKGDGDASVHYSIPFGFSCGF